MCNDTYNYFKNFQEKIKSRYKTNILLPLDTRSKVKTDTSCLTGLVLSSSNPNHKLKLFNYKNRTKR